MSFFIKEENVRPGNRGGRTLFNWNDIRLLNNKERESYLGVTQSIGFLDKGGKWRKRDWWQGKANPLKFEINQNEILSEKEHIKQEEQRLFNEAMNNLYGTTSNNSNNKSISSNAANQKKEKLTVFEWKELMKKEANLTVDDPKIFEFYENDDHKRGLGMKQNISFRTNPYEKEAMQRIRKLDGEGFNEVNEEEENLKQKSERSMEKSSEGSAEKNKSDKIRRKDKKDKEEDLLISKNRNINAEFLQKKEHLGGKSYAEFIDIWEKEQLDKKKYLEKANLGGDSTKDKSKRKSKMEKKEKKHKKEKKKKDEKKSKKRNSKYKSENEYDSDDSYDRNNKSGKRRNRSHSRSRSKSRSNSRRKHRD